MNYLIAGVSSLVCANVVVPAPAELPRFEQAKVLEVAGVVAAWADYDNDGWVDLYADGQLWKNNAGTLEKVTSAEPGLRGKGVWGDFNNDGWLDFFTYSETNHLVHLNNKDGTFTTSEMEEPGARASLGAVVGDLNGDGFADVYVGAYEEYPVAYFPDKIALNDGTGALTITWTQGIDAVTTPGRPRPARGITAADWDRDGDLDIYVSNYRLEPNALWRNDGTGTFVDVAPSHNAEGTSGGFRGGHTIGSVFADFDNDGLLDLFVGNFSHPGQPASQLLRNRGPEHDYAFEYMGTGGIGWQESFASPVAADFDNDGYLDLYFTTVYRTGSGGLSNSPVLLRNNGDWTFTDVTAEWGLPTSGVVTYQAAVADYDNDGYLDLVTNDELYRNTGGTNHWLKVRLDGGAAYGNSPTGAQVIIKLADKTLVRHIEGAVGQGNQNDQTLHFGLGQHTGALVLEVYWPGRTSPQKATVDQPNQTITVSVSDFPQK